MNRKALLAAAAAAVLCLSAVSCSSLGKKKPLTGGVIFFNNYSAIGEQAIGGPQEKCSVVIRYFSGDIENRFFNQLLNMISVHFNFKIYNISGEDINYRKVNGELNEGETEGLPVPFINLRDGKKKEYAVSLEKMPPVELAARFKADYVIDGEEISRDDNEVIYDIKIFDGESGRLLFSRRAFLDRSGLIKNSEELVSELRSFFPGLEGLVISSDGSFCTLNLGRIDGIRQGMRFFVYRPRRVKRDHDSGAVLGYEREYIGKVVIEEISERNCTGRILHLVPQGAILQGDEAGNR